MIIVMIIVGVLGSFGAEALFNAYESYLFSSAQSRLQSDSETAAYQISNRLEYRIKDSVIAREAGGAFRPLANANGSETILEWVGVDREGWQGTDSNSTQPNWSGFIDLDHNLSGINTLVTPGTNTALINSSIAALSTQSTTVNDAALFFIGGGVDVLNGFGWNGALANQNGSLHPVITTAAVNQFAPGVGNFNNIDVYEHYLLSWSAYAVVHVPRVENGVNSGSLFLYYDYQPWQGETYLNGSVSLLMDNVDTFAFRSVGDIIKIQVCVTDNNLLEGTGGYSICKEQTVF